MHSTHTQAWLAICFKWSGLRKTRKKWGNFDETIHFAFFIPLLSGAAAEKQTTNPEIRTVSPHTHASKHILDEIWEG